jgi:endonuclease/exonuclease/phosphatase family metal-dependent hydrolase
VRVGTYNIGAGNEEASTEENFERTRGLIADEIVHGGSEVINLQEVGVDGRLTGGRDNNQEILESVFVEELGDEWRDADLSRVSLDEDGKPVRDDDNQPVYDPEAYADTRVTATNDEGQRRNMDVTRQRYNDQGEPVDWSEGPAQGHVVSYEAEAAPGKNYTLVFGSSSDGGTYGNGVLLAPGHEVTDVERRVLGQDDPDNGDDEYRTALGVTFTTPGGQTVSTVSAHLTNGQQESRGNNRNDQYHALDDFVEDLHQDDRPVIVGGDFNSRAGGQYAKEWYDALPFIDPPRHPSAGDLGWNDPDRDNNSIDRLYTVGGVEVGDRQDYEGQGGSDHDYVAWDVAV